MKTIFEHIEHVKAQPHHIRKQVAFASAASLTVLIALVWFVDSLSTGSFSIKGSSFASSQEQSAVTKNSDTSGNKGLAGVSAAGALPEVSNTPAHIEIIDAVGTPAKQNKTEQTTLPF